MGPVLARLRDLGVNLSDALSPSARGANRADYGADKRARDPLPPGWANWAAEEADALAGLLLEERLGDPEGIALAGYDGPRNRANVTEFLLANW